MMEQESHVPPPSTETTTTTTTTSEDCCFAPIFTTSNARSSRIIQNEPSSLNFLVVGTQQDQHQHQHQHPEQSSSCCRDIRNDTEPCHRTVCPLSLSPTNTTSSSSSSSVSSSTRKRLRATCKYNLCIALVCCFLFSIITASVLALWHSFRLRAQEQEQREALAIAADTGNWFSAQLTSAIQPLYTMTNYATEIEAFANLPSQIGPGILPHENNTNTTLIKKSLPFLPSSDETNPYSKRDIRGVCNQPPLVARFDKLASTVLRQAHMEGVLANVQFSPYGVVCLLYPLLWNFTNAEQDVLQLNNTDAYGRDLLNDVRHKDFARQALKGDAIGIVGPRSLIQCPDCGNFFIVRLPVVAPEIDIVIDTNDTSTTYHRWGYTTVLINWNALVDRSTIRERFQSRGMAFRLTDNNPQLVNKTLLAESFEFDENQVAHQYSNLVSTEITADNWNWVMTIHYNAGPTKLETVLVCVVTICVAAIVSVLVYITLTQKQAMLGEMLAQQAKVDLERSMTAYFSHELRNPLSAMECAIECMPLKDMPEESQELLDSMRVCSSFMSSIMNNLLDARKMEEGKMLLKRQPVSLTTLVTNVENMIRPSVKGNVVLQSQVYTDSNSNTNTINNTNNDWVLGDAMRLQQILTNVLSNAIKYTLEGSITVTVRWTPLLNNDMPASIKQDNSNHRKNSKHQQEQEEQRRQVVRIEVADTGPGIPKEDLDQIFERFVQRGGAPGSGLGLAIVKQLVTLMNGTVRFESDPTVKPGTTCVIILPLEPCTSGDAASEHAESEQHRQQTKILGNGNHSNSVELEECVIEQAISVLIVDDIKMNRSMLKRRFEKCIAPNCVITEASSGEEALKLVETETFDIIIQDQYLEEGGGILVGTDVITAMRRSKVDSIIIGYSGNDLDEKFKAAGADLVWSKPMPSNQTIIKSLKALLVER